MRFWTNTGRCATTASEELYAIRRAIKDKEGAVSRRIQAILRKAQEEAWLMPMPLSLYARARF